MAERSRVEAVARGIIDLVSREFPGVSLALDFDTPTDEHEDAHLWITPDTDDRDEINDIWALTIKMVQDAFEEQDIYLVARMPGVGPIIRDRPQDKD